MHFTQCFVAEQSHPGTGVLCPRHRRYNHHRFVAPTNAGPHTKISPSGWMILLIRVIRWNKVERRTNAGQTRLIIKPSRAPVRHTSRGVFIGYKEMRRRATFNLCCAAATKCFGLRRESMHGSLRLLAQPPNSNGTPPVPLQFPRSLVERDLLYIKFAGVHGMGGSVSSKTRLIGGTSRKDARHNFLR
jgi:hypothetical protein